MVRLMVERRGSERALSSRRLHPPNLNANRCLESGLREHRPRRGGETAGHAVPTIGFGMGEATHLEQGFSRVPVQSFISRDDGAGRRPPCRRRAGRCESAPSWLHAAARSFSCVAVAYFSSNIK